MKRCMYCGNENNDTSLNCSKCGNRLLDAPIPSAVETEVPEEAAPMEEIASAAEDAAEQITENLQEIAEPIQSAAAETEEKDIPDFLRDQGQEAAPEAAPENSYEQQYGNEPQYDQPQYAARPDVPYGNGYPYGYAPSSGAQAVSLTVIRDRLSSMVSQHKIRLRAFMTMDEHSNCRAEMPEHLCKKPEEE